MSYMWKNTENHVWLRKFTDFTHENGCLGIESPKLDEKQLSTRERISSNIYPLVHRKSPLSNFLEQRSIYDNGFPCYSTTFEGEMVWRRYPLPSRVGLLSSRSKLHSCKEGIFGHSAISSHVQPLPHLGCYLPRRRNPPGQIPVQKSQQEVNANPTW